MFISATPPEIGSQTIMVLSSFFIIFSGPVKYGSSFLLLKILTNTRFPWLLFGTHSSNLLTSITPKLICGFNNVDRFLYPFVVLHEFCSQYFSFSYFISPFSDKH